MVITFRKIISLVIMFVLALTSSGYVKYFYHPKKVAVSKEATKTLTNTLSDSQASVEKVTIDGSTFLTLSSIHPFLRPGAKATVTQIAIKDGWNEPHYGISQKQVYLFQAKYLLSLRKEGQTIYLDGQDVQTQQKQQPINLGTLDSSILSDGAPANDVIADITMNTTTKTITYVIRRNITFPDPVAGGTAQKNSQAEIWTVEYPDGQPKKIDAIQSLFLGYANGTGLKVYDIPIRAYPVGGKIVLEYRAGVYVYDALTKKLSTLLNVGANGYATLSMAPSNTKAVIYAFHDHSTTSKTSIDQRAYLINEQLQLKPFPIPVDDSLSTVSWSPNENYAVLEFLLGKVFRLSQSTMQATELSSSFSASRVSIYDVLTENSLLIGVQNAQTPLDEIPTYDPNGLTQMAVWNINDGSLTQVGNYRTPLYIGRL